MHGLSAVPGLVTLVAVVPVSAWWFGRVEMLPRSPGPAIGTASSDVLLALIVIQVLLLCLFVPRWVAAQAAGPTIAGSLGVVLVSVLPAWPLLATLALASPVPIAGVILAEACIIGAGLGAAALASLSARLPAGRGAAAQGIVGLLLAGSALLLLARWLPGGAA